MGPLRSADADATSARGPRWKSRRAIVAWIAVIACIGLVLWAGSETFSVHSTSRFLRPLLFFLFPEWTSAEIWRAEVWMRRTAHAVEYALLALLAFRALWLSFDTILSRLAAGAMLLALVVATVDETRQGFLKLRTGSPSDVLLDCLGALLAVGLAVLYLQRRQSPQDRERSGC